MPTAALRPCAGNCGAKVSHGRCPSCSRKQAATRRAGRTLTYAEPWWRAFRTAFVGLLQRQGIAPLCGAKLPDGPTHNPSLCKQQGLKTYASSHGSLHLHHEPALTEAEQADRSIVCDPNRIILLCDTCHNADDDHRWQAQFPAKTETIWTGRGV